MGASQSGQCENFMPHSRHVMQCPHGRKTVATRESKHILHSKRRYVGSSWMEPRSATISRCSRSFSFMEDGVVSTSHVSEDRQHPISVQCFF